MTKIEGIIEMIEDGMRDARKECMWTEEMQNGTDKEGAEMFRNEATKRIQGVKEMLEKHGQLIEDPAAAPAIAKAWKKRLDAELVEKMNMLQKFK